MNPENFIMNNKDLAEDMVVKSGIQLLINSNLANVFKNIIETEKVFTKDEIYSGACFYKTLVDIFFEMAEYVSIIRMKSVGQAFVECFTNFSNIITLARLNDEDLITTVGNNTGNIFKKLQTSGVLVNENDKMNYINKLEEIHDRYICTFKKLKFLLTKFNENQEYLKNQKDVFVDLLIVNGISDAANIFKCATETACNLSNSYNEQKQNNEPLENQN